MTLEVQRLVSAKILAVGSYLSPCLIGCHLGWLLVIGANHPPTFSHFHP